MAVGETSPAAAASVADDGPAPAARKPRSGAETGTAGAAASADGANAATGVGWQAAPAPSVMANASPGPAQTVPLQTHPHVAGPDGGAAGAGMQLPPEAAQLHVGAREAQVHVSGQRVGDLSAWLRLDSGGQVEIRLETSRLAAHDLLMQALPSLQEGLGRQGVPLGGVTVSGFGPAGHAPDLAWGAGLAGGGGPGGGAAGGPAGHGPGARQPDPGLGWPGNAAGESGLAPPELRRARWRGTGVDLLL
ncbi:MAG: flagellar hook-length control protein FliK [Bacillota bacterium]|nr:flagellar hook-length control protein FliK [Bacillota bacterium]